MVPLVELYLDSNKGLGRGPQADVALEKYSVHIDQKSDESEIQLRRDGETRLKSLELMVEEPLFSTQESRKLLEQGTFTMTEDPEVQAIEETLRNITLAYEKVNDVPGAYTEECQKCRRTNHTTAQCTAHPLCLKCMTRGHLREFCSAVCAK